jgi:vacuolar protein 8
MAEIEGLVRALREGDDAVKLSAAQRLGDLAWGDDANWVLIAEAGGITPLVELLRDGNAPLGVSKAEYDAAMRVLNAVLQKYNERPHVPLPYAGRVSPAEAKCRAARVLGNLARDNANKILIAEAGGIPLLLELARNARDGDWVAKGQAAWALGNLARNNDANALAIALAVGLEAFVELARCGSVTFVNRSIVRDASVPAKRKAARVVAALLDDCVPDSVPHDVEALIVSYL